MEATATPDNQQEYDLSGGIVQPQQATQTQAQQTTQQATQTQQTQPGDYDLSAGIVAPPAHQPGFLERLGADPGAYDFAGSQVTGFGKEGLRALAGMLKIVHDHSTGILPQGATDEMTKGANWLNQKGQLRGWNTPGGAGEHVGAIGADILGFEVLKALVGKGGGAGAEMLGNTELVQSLRQAATVGDLADKFPVLAHALSIGLRTVNQAMPYLESGGVGAGQAYIMSGGNAKEAGISGLLTSLLHLGSNVSIGPLGEYLKGLEEAGLSPKIPELTLEPQDLRPRSIKPPPPEIEPEPKPQPRAQATPPPAVDRFGPVEQQVAQQVAKEHLEDLNSFRRVNESGTPTNIQQPALPSQSVTQPYEFQLPGWSATSTAGDLLHEAGARYKQVGTRVVEGKGSAQMQPWEMGQVPFDIARYAETPGGVVRNFNEETGELSPLPEPQAQPTEPRASSPVWPQRETGEPPTTSPVYHKEPIMQPTEYRTGVRPGSDIRQETTIGGPSVLTTDPDIAAGHLDQIERIVQGPNFDALPLSIQHDILESRGNVLQQMREYQNLAAQHQYSPYLHQPTFQPLDIDSAMSRITDMGKAADEMMRGPKEMYNTWNDATQGRPGGSFQDLNEELNDLIDKSGQANRQRLAEVEAEMHQMFNGSDPFLGRTGTNIDRAVARAQFADGYLVKRIDDKITNAFTGAERSGDFEPDRLQSGWKALVNEVGSPKMRNVLGAERYEWMNNSINDLAAEPAAQKAEAEAIKTEHAGEMEQWKQRQEQRTQEAADAYEKDEEERKAALDQARKDWNANEALRQARNKMATAEWRQKMAKMNERQRWYFQLARNGWFHMMSGVGLEGVAHLLPPGWAMPLAKGAGAALILKQIITHPLTAKLAYQGARLGANPAIYSQVIADALHTPQQQPQPTAAQPAATTAPAGAPAQAKEAP